MDGLTLNQLRVLSVLLTTESVTRTSSLLSLSQPSISRMLRQLRGILNDELLVRVGSGMVCTPRALALREPLHRALAGLDQVLHPLEDFQPKTLGGSVRIAAVDYLHVMLTELAQRIAVEAPDVMLVLANLDPQHDMDDRALMDGRLDLVVSPPRNGVAGLRWTPLRRERYLCVYDPVSGVAPDLDAFVSRPHVLVAPYGVAGGIVDEALAELGRSRRILCEVRSFALAPYVLCGTDRICTMPEPMAERVSRDFGLAVVEPPLQVPGFQVSMGWHERYAGDPRHRWLRQLITHCLSNMKHD